MDIGTLVLGVVAGLTWLIVILVLVQLSRFLAKFEQGRQELDANIIGMAGQLKKMQTTIAEILIEQETGDPSYGGGARPEEGGDDRRFRNHRGAAAGDAGRRSRTGSDAGTAADLGSQEAGRTEVSGVDEIAGRSGRRINSSGVDLIMKKFLLILGIAGVLFAGRQRKADTNPGS